MQFPIFIAILTALSMALPIPTAKFFNPDVGIQDLDSVFQSDMEMAQQIPMQPALIASTFQSSANSPGVPASAAPANYHSSQNTPTGSVRIISSNKSGQDRGKSSGVLGFLADLIEDWLAKLLQMKKAHLGLFDKEIE
ncbi:hypothetical protein NEOLI_001419 [Neolecta irregularis DAH-3]|uniref:Uncharacterized protein n=1 Tax=Neolecta irregularis (strain DAH-3) TaxID=1198029 RepID=A0A1U7LG69_NEOID|nr:hypothetical protein NEOLI_001419 [Neolecta irregularis DAH-3]|eukprot:OLL21650.1 hypothetical protein NEOLI_001419 [Neolecta irregularis DAH-3]